MVRTALEAPARSRSNAADELCAAARSDDLPEARSDDRPLVPLAGSACPPPGRRALLLGAGRRDRDLDLLLADPGRLAGETTEVIELRAPHPAAPHHDDLRDHRAVRGKDALHTHTVRDFAHGERLADTRSPARNADPLERLQPLLLTFDYPNIDAQRVAGAKRGNPRAQPRLLGFAEFVHGSLSVFDGRQGKIARGGPARQSFSMPALALRHRSRRRNPRLLGNTRGKTQRGPFANRRSPCSGNGPQTDAAADADTHGCRSRHRHTRMPQQTPTHTDVCLDRRHDRQLLDAHRYLPW